MAESALQTQSFSCQGGLITSMDALRQGKESPGSAITLLNFEPHPAGGYRRVQGYAKFDPAAVPGTGDILGVAVMGTLGGVVACRGTDVYTSTGTGWTKRNGANVRTTGAYTRFARYGYMGSERVVLVNGTDRPHAYDPATTTYTVLTTAPLGADCACEFYGRMFYGKNNLLTFSAPFLENDFTGASGGGQINVGTPITGLAVWRDQLIVFGSGRIQKITGTSLASFAMVPVTSSLGCPWGESIQEINGDILFLAHDGLRTFAGTGNFFDTELGSISKAIQGPLTDIARTYTRIVSCTIRKKSQYRILTSSTGLSAGGTSGAMAVLRSEPPTNVGAGSTQGGNWEFALLKGLKATCADSWVIPGTERELAVFGNDAGYVYQQESGQTFDGNPILATYQTPFLSFDDVRVRKIFRKLQAYIDAEGGFTVTAALILDLNQSGVVQPFSDTITATGSGTYTFGTSTAIFGTSTFGGTTLPLVETNLVGAGFTGSFRFSVDTSCPAFSIKTLACELSLGARR